MTTAASITVRPSRPEDVPAIARIYAHWVVHGLASFELEPPETAEMTARRARLVEAGYPYLVAADAARDGAVLGYTYTGPYRTRPAYRFAVEDSIYVAPEAAGRGIGARLLPALVEACEALGFRVMVAVIGDGGNAPSVALHRRFGFAHAGLLPSVGWKHGRWVDSVLMTRPLGPGAASPPTERER